LGIYICCGCGTKKQVSTQASQQASKPAKHQASKQERKNNGCASIKKKSMAVTK